MGLLFFEPFKIFTNGQTLNGYSRYLTLPPLSPFSFFFNLNDLDDHLGFFFMLSTITF